MRWAIAAAALLSMGCGPAGKAKYALEGSLTDVYDLGYDVAYLEGTDTDFTVRFARAQGEGENTILKVNVTLLTGEQLKPNLTWDLAEVLPNGHQRAVLARNVLNEQPPMFPDVLRGKLTMHQVPTERGQFGGGEFNVTFVTGIMPADGRTVFSTSFQAKIP